MRIVEGEAVHSQNDIPAACGARRHHAEKALALTAVDMDDIGLRLLNAIAEKTVDF